MIKRYIHLFFLVILVLVKRDALQAQDPYYWQLTDEDGLPSMTVYQVTQAQTGLIWIATANGLCSFDGKNIQQYDNSALNDQEILKIQEAPDGKIWGLNLSGQLFFLNHTGKLEVVEQLGEEKLSKVTDFIWIQNYLVVGTYYFSNNTFNSKVIIHKESKNENVLFLELRLIHSFSLLKDNAILINTTDGKFRVLYKLESFSNLIEILKDSPLSNRHLIVNNDNIYFALQNKLACYDYKLGKIISNYAIPETPKNSVVTNGYIYLFFTKGLIKKKLDNNFEQKLFKEKSINHLFIDKEGNHFFATNEGLLIAPSEKNKLLYNGKTTALFSSLTRQIVGTGSGSLIIFEGANSFKKDNVMKEAILTINQLGNQFLCSGNNGIEKIEQTTLRTFGKTQLAVKTNFIDSKNNIWIGTSNSFQNLSNPKFKPIPIRTYAIAETADGIIWIGSDKGIYRYDGVEIKPFRDEKEQMPYRVSAMKIDSENRLWVTTTSHGIVVIKDNKTEKTLNNANGFLTNTFNCVYINNKIVWLGSDKGVIRYNPATGEKLLINKYYGLPSNEILSLCTDKENLLIGTAKGLITMPFDAMKPNTVAPNIHLLQVKVNEIQRDISDKTLNLQYQENNILLEYVSYQYRSRGNARYEYRIMELDINWTMTEQRSLRFPNLSAGDYHFELRAINECDIRSDKTISLYIRIAKPYWLQWWFIASVMGLIGFGVWAVSYQRFRRLQQQQEIEHDFKTKINDLRVQALQAQMNPHFIFNALNAIQHFLTINDDDNAILFLSKFARLIRMVFEYSKKKEITFAQEIEMLEVYLSLEKLRFKDKVNIHFNIAETVEKEKENIYLLPLLIQPIIENSFKHGLFHKKANGNLYISFDLQENKGLKCVIEDDGIGRNQSAEYTTWRKQQKHTSSGLAATEERLKFWHEKNNNPIKDYMLIEDLMKNGEANGTRVTIIL